MKKPLIALLLVLGIPAYAGETLKTALPAGDYEYYGTTETGRSTSFSILGDGTAVVRSKNWLKKETPRFPLTSLKPGFYKRLHANPTMGFVNGDKFQILGTGEVKLAAEYDDGPLPFEAPNPQLAESKPTN